MKTEEVKNGKGTIAGQIILILTVFSSVVALSVGLFLHFYSAYNDKLIYRERLSQMKEITTQLFTGLDDVVDHLWQQTESQCRYLEADEHYTLDGLSDFMGKQSVLNDFTGSSIHLIAVDAEGRYYTKEGLQGSLREMNFLLDAPERLSFVANSMTTNQTSMVFLKRIHQSITVENMGKNTCLIYYGILQDMTELASFFECRAYDGNNSVYVVDFQGLKLFRRNVESEELLKGYNAFTVLDNMEYQHGSSFADAKAALDSQGIAYSNAVLDGIEYYYALYHMKSANWTLIFLVPSEYVAINTVALVKTSIKAVLIFAICLVVFTGALIFIILWTKQRQALLVERKNRLAFQTAFQAAKEANRAKSDFLANMSHDIRTPLNGIMGITKLMSLSVDNPDKVREYIGKIQASSLQLLGMVNEVLDMSRMENRQTVLHPEPVTLEILMKHVENVIRPQAVVKRQHLEVILCPETGKKILCDVGKMQQILQNLMSNAVKYTAEDGKIILQVEERTSGNPVYARYSFIVEDNGIGMDESFLQHIFEPFTRAEQSVVNRIQGTGLGMAITKSLVDLMGGTIHVESTPGVGSRVEVILEFKLDE